MKKHTPKYLAPYLIAAGLLILLAPNAFAGLTSMTGQELKAVTGQSGIGTLVEDGLTDEQRREQENNNKQLQALASLAGRVPSELIRDLQDIRRTGHEPCRIHGEFQTVRHDLLAMPTAVTTILSIPAGLNTGGFFF